MSSWHSHNNSCRALNKFFFVGISRLCRDASTVHIVLCYLFFHLATAVCITCVSIVVVVIVVVVVVCYMQPTICIVLYRRVWPVRALLCFYQFDRKSESLFRWKLISAAQVCIIQLNVERRTVQTYNFFGAVTVTCALFRSQLFVLNILFSVLIIENKENIEKKKIK